MSDDNRGIGETILDWIIDVGVWLFGILLSLALIVGQFITKYLFGQFKILARKMVILFTNVNISYRK